MSVVDPIDAISGVKRKTQANPATPCSAHLGKQSDFLYNTNYVIAVMQLTQVCMKHQQELVAIRSKLAEITTKIQADLNVLNQTMSTFENQAGPSPNSNSGDANYYNGFSTSFASFPTQTACAPSAALITATNSQLNAFFDLFYCSPSSSSSDVTVSDLMKMDNPIDPKKSFDLSGFWTGANGIADGFNTHNIKNGVPGKGYQLRTNIPMISGVSSDHPSLIMQYVYWQSKLNLYQTSPEDIAAAGGDFTRLPGMNFDPRDQGFDPNLANILSVIDAHMNVMFPISGQGAGYGSYLEYLVEAKENSPIMLYIDDAWMAYSYFWTKDPQAKNLDNSDGSAHANHGTDNLSDIYTKTSSAQAALSSASSAQGTNFQQDTSGMTTENNEVQQIISSFMQGQGAVVGNFKGA